LYARSSRLTMGHFPLALFSLLLFPLTANPLIKRLGWAPLSPQELLVVVSMGLVGAVMPVDGIVGYLLGIISSFYYFATPENQWASYLHPHLPGWLVPRGSPAIWQQFFEGTGLERGIPWEMWAIPLFWWAILIGAILWVSACLMVIMRKQWTENERLVYPLAAVAIEMVGGSRQGMGFRAVWTNRLFWIGLSAALIPFTLEILSWVFPTFPLGQIFPYFRGFELFKGARAFVINPFHFYSMGFAFLAPVEVQFSVWFFYLLIVLEGGIFDRLGYTISATGSDAFSTRPPAIGWQGYGAIVFIVLWSCWTGRGHLKDVFRKAFKHAPDVDDSQEMMSYRTAVWGAILGILIMGGWLWKSGMELPAVVLYILSSLFLYIGLARIVVEGGLPYTWGPISPQVFTFNVLGTSTLSGATVTSLLLSYSLINYLRGLFMPVMAHVARLADLLPQNRRRLLPVLAVAAAVGLIFSLFYTLNLAYTHGAYNTYGFPPFFGGNPKAIFSNTLSKVRNPFRTDWNRIMFMGIGAGAMGILSILRSRILWWRLSPIGFATASMINTNFLVVPFFLAWVVKSTVLSLGGVQLYRKTLTLFIGLLVGYTVGVSLCSVVDMVFYPQQGHVVHTW
ncbi:MAG: hypothetical protein O2954_00900, partial [bacterium]|nr:hypothetical protein [bacterium]